MRPNKSSQIISMTLKGRGTTCTSVASFKQHDSRKQDYQGKDVFGIQFHVRIVL